MAEIWFWVGAGVMLVLVALVLGQALRRGRDEALAAPGSEDLGVYRDQLSEVERDLARGTLPLAEADRLKAEIARRMLAADARASASGSSARAAAPLPLTLGLVGLALAGAAGLYLWLGAPAYPDLPLQDRLAASQALYDNRPSQEKAEALAPKLDPPTNVDPQVMQLIEQLRAAVKDNPDDPKGLAFLAQYEASLGNFAAAEAAQSHLIEVKGEQVTAEDHAALAELMIRAAGGFVSPEAERQLIAALQLDPRNAPARYFSGMMFLQVGRPDRTFELWQPLLAEGPEDAPWTQPIRDQIQDVAAVAGIRYELPASRGPSAEDMSAAAQMSPEERQAMIENMVAGLETRLMQDGGPVEDWAKLIGALGVLGQTDRAQVAYDAAKTAYAAEPGALSALQASAVKAGLTP